MLRKYFPEDSGNGLRQRVNRRRCDPSGQLRNEGSKQLETNGQHWSMAFGRNARNQMAGDGK